MSPSIPSPRSRWSSTSPVCQDNPYKIDVEETKKLLDQYRPEFIIFGKSMVLHKEPVAEIRQVRR